MSVVSLSTPELSQPEQINMVTTSSSGEMDIQCSLYCRETETETEVISYIRLDHEVHTIGYKKGRRVNTKQSGSTAQYNYDGKRGSLN